MINEEENHLIEEQISQNNHQHQQNLPFIGPVGLGSNWGYQMSPNHETEILENGEKSPINYHPFQGDQNDKNSSSILRPSPPPTENQHSSGPRCVERVEKRRDYDQRRRSNETRKERSRIPHSPISTTTNQKSSLSNHHGRRGGNRNYYKHPRINKRKLKSSSSSSSNQLSHEEKMKNEISSMKITSSFLQYCLQDDQTTINNNNNSSKTKTNKRRIPSFLLPHINLLDTNDKGRKENKNEEWDQIGI